MPHDLLILTVGTVIGLCVALAGCLFNRRFVSEENAERIIELEVHLADMRDSRNYYREEAEQAARAALVEKLSAVPYCNTNNQPQKEPNNYGP